MFFVKDLPRRAFKEGSSKDKPKILAIALFFYDWYSGIKYINVIFVKNISKWKSNMAKKWKRNLKEDSSLKEDFFFGRRFLPVPVLQNNFGYRVPWSTTSTYSEQYSKLDLKNYNCAISREFSHFLIMTLDY